MLKENSDSERKTTCSSGLCIKQFLSASNTDFSDISLTIDRTNSFIYQQRFMEIQDRYHHYIPVYTDGITEMGILETSNTIIFMRLSDSASISHC